MRFGSRARRFLIAATVLLLVLVVAPAAGASVYWTNTSTIGRAGGDGTAVNQAFIGGASAPCGVAADAAHVYWTNSDSGTIGRANLDGTGVDQSFITGLNAPCGVAVDGAHVYWTNVLDNGGGIGRTTLDGTGVDESFVAGLAAPLAVAVDDAHLYWADQGAIEPIGRANLDGTGVDRNFIDGGALPCGVAVDRAHVYWTSGNNGAVGRANLDGSGVDQHFIDVGNGLPCGVAVDSAHVYWTSFNTNADDPAGSAIGRANLDGSSPNPALITGALFPEAVAVDAEQPAGISVDDVTRTEGDAGQTAFRFAVSLDRPESAPVTVGFSTNDRSASAPSDYTATSGAVTFAPGETTKQVTVQVNGDSAIESDETFDLNLANVAGNATVADPQGVATIVNDDQPGTEPPGATGAPGGGTIVNDPKPVSHKFALGNARLNTKKGTATLAVTVPGPGRLAISVGGRTTGGAARSIRVRAAGAVRLLIRASGREQRKLARTGRVTVKVTVRYTPSGGRPSTRSTSVRLKQR
jgi:virginiamycin B lyase